jgi:FHA domain
LAVGILAQSVFRSQLGRQAFIMETQRFDDLFVDDDEVEAEEEIVAMLKILPSATAEHAQAGQEQEFPLALGREYVVGNDGGVCDIVLDLPGLSKQHARLTVAQDVADSSLLLLAVKDLASTNGTFYQNDEGKQVCVMKNKVATLRVPTEIWLSSKVKATVTTASIATEAQTTQAATPVPSEAPTQAQLPPDSATATQPQLPTQQQSAVNGTEVNERAPSPVTQPQPALTSSPSAVQFNVNVPLSVSTSLKPHND